MSRKSAGLICLMLISAGLMIGCQQESQTLPNKPTGTVPTGEGKTTADQPPVSDETVGVNRNQQDTASNQKAVDTGSSKASDSNSKVAGEFTSDDEKKSVAEQTDSMKKSESGLIVKDELPDADISDEASDLNIEPEYVDPRKHDPVFAAEKDWLRLAQDYPLWIDREKKQVIVDGRIAQVHALLEMLACPVDSGKEHESVIGVYCNSELMHAALLAVGAKPGHPVIFQPEFKAAAGTKISIDVIWEENGEKKKVDAKQWVRHLNTKETLDVDWVFGGSQIYIDDRTGNKYYLANGGEMVCVSNFSTAMLDLPAKSSSDAAQQEYEANTDAIPPLNTPVRLIFKPDLKSFAGKTEASVEAKTSDTGSQPETDQPPQPSDK